MALLDRGVVPVGLGSTPKHKELATPLLSQVIKDYLKDPIVLVAPSAEPLLSILVSELPRLRMSEITYQWANEWIASHKKLKLAPGTIRKRVGTLSQVVDWYCRNNPSNTNILKLLPRGYSRYPDLAVVDVQRNRRLTPCEEALIYASLKGVKREDRERSWGPDPLFELFYSLLVGAGLRLKEAYTLTVGGLKLDKGYVYVMGFKGHYGAIKPRTVPLHRPLIDKLRNQTKNSELSSLVFPYWDGTKEDFKRCQLRITNRFSTLFSYSGLVDITAHDLRHEACCRWVTLRNATGWVFNELEICKIMGWSDPKMMLRYASLRAEDFADRLNSL